MRKVDEFPKRKKLEEKDEYIGEESDIYRDEHALKEVRTNGLYGTGSVSYLTDQNTGQKWIKDYYSSKATNFDLLPRLRKVEKFPWE